MFSWIPSKGRDTASRASSSTTTPWLSTIESTEHIIEGANANANAESVFSRQFKDRFVLKLAEAVAAFEAQRASKKTAEEAEDAKLAEIVGAPLAVVVAGAAGLGKSSLINAVFAVDVAEKGAGVPVTATATAFVDPTGFVKVIDTQGFTRSPSKNSNFKGEDLVHFVNEAITPNPSKPLPHVDMLWYFVDRIEDEDVKVLKSLVEKQVPFLVIIAKCDAKDLAEIETIRRQIHSVLSPQKSDNENSIEGDATIDNLIHSLELDAAIRGWDIVELRNPPNTTSGLKCMGCGSAKAVLRPLAPPNSNLNAWYCINQECIFSKDLYLKMEDTRSLKDSLTMLSSSVNALLNNIPTRRFQIAKLLTDQSSHLTSMSIPIVTAATLAAAGIGATPLPFADMPLLIATQCTMILSICRVFGVSPASGLNDPTFYLSILAASPFPFLGILVAGAAKTIPGVGSVGAAVVEAPIAGGLTMAMGITVIQTCVALYKLKLEKGVDQEFRFDREVQGRVHASFKGTAQWIRGAFRGGGFTERAIGDRILMEVARGESAEVPMLAFEGGDGGGELEVEESSEITPVEVDVDGIREGLGKVRTEEVVQVFVGHGKVDAVKNIVAENK